MKTRIFLFAAGAVAAMPAASQAQAFDVQQLQPGSSQSTSVIDVDQARILHAGAWELGLFLHHADSPLQFRDTDDSRSDIVGSQTQANILFGVGIADRLELGIDIPLFLAQSGDQIGVAGIPDASDAGFGLGDLRVLPTISFFDGNTEDSPGGAALALGLDLTLPTGDDAAYQGDGALRIEPRLAFDIATRSQTILSLNVGYLIRDRHDVLNVRADDALTWGAGIQIPIGSKGLSWLTELHGDYAFGADDAVAQAPMEAGLGLRWLSSGGLLLQGGGGLGLVHGYGTPAWRAFLGLAYHKEVDCDPDDDGIGCEGTIDECPYSAEDMDGFQDADGCPDDDNDQDGIADRRDQCPNDPEDHDDFEDSDGCPDPDNDGDLIFDADDECPNEPEDVDGFEDLNGCPDPDNDQDGVLDVDDACPLVPEDIDEFEDEDGCPDADNDVDGLLDGDDACPIEPEDFDGFEDSDGCPEEGSGMVQLTCEAIEIRDSVYFDTDSDVIQSRSYELLDQVAGVLRAASYVRKLRVEGHTDSRGSDEHNLDLSQRRAASVMRYLVDHGIDAGRLESEGYGETRPIATNDTSDGRAQNRRVVFFIVEQDSDCGQVPVSAPGDVGAGE